MQDDATQDDDMPPWAVRLNQAFKATRWSAVTLAERAGVEVENVYKYLAGKVKQPRGDVLDKLARAMQRKPLWLKEGIDPVNYRAEGVPAEPPMAYHEAPVEPSGSTDELLADIIVQLDELHKTGGVALVLHDLALAGHRMMSAILAEAPDPDDWPDAMQRQLDIQRRHLRRHRRAILFGDDPSDHESAP